MPSTATFALPKFEGIGLLAFLRRELKPDPDRWRSTLRLTLACLAATIPIMVFHLKQPVIVMLVIFLIASGDKTTSLLGSILSIVGVTLGCGTLLLYYVCAVDLIWLRILCVPAFIGLGLFINRVFTLGPLGTAISVPMAIGMVIPDIVPNPEFLCRFPFYLWWAGLLGLSVNYGAHLLLNKNTSQSVLLRGLFLRLDAVESSLRQMAAGHAIQPQDSTLYRFALEGIIEPLHLLALAGKIEPWLKKHQAELRAKFMLTDRLVEAAALLEQRKDYQLDESIKQRLLYLASACAHWRRAIRHDNTIPTWPASPDIPVPSTSAHFLAPLSEMERVVALMPFTFKNGDLPPELKAPEGKQKAGVLVPDAFTNPEYIHFAIKGALAGLICYLIFTSVKYEGIDTAVTTCIVCSLATVGASVQKGILRIAGATIGGFLGFLTLIYIFPNLDSLGGFWLPVTAVTALAAYVNFGSARIAYCGFQINYAFFNCVLQSYGPYTELRVVRDRLIGILLGLSVYGVINNRLWPVRALKKTEENLAAAFRRLAELAVLPDDGLDPAPQLAAAYGLRLRFYQDLANIRQLLESSKFESGGPRRAYLEKVKDDLQLIFLRVLAIIQHRADLRPHMAPEFVRAAAIRLRETASETLRAFANRIEGKTAAPPPDLHEAMDELDRAVQTEIDSITDRENANRILARLALYSETVALTETMLQRPA